MLKAFKKGVKLCHFGEMGDRFFIILEGHVGVRVPNWHEKSYNCVWDVLQYVIQEYDNIMQIRDSCSRDCSQIIKILGHKFLK